MSEFKSPKDCREPEYQEFALSRWKSLSDEEKKNCSEHQKIYANENFLRIPESAKENLYRRMWGMPLVEGEEWSSSDLMDHKMGVRVGEGYEIAYGPDGTVITLNGRVLTDEKEILEFIDKNFEPVDENVAELVRLEIEQLKKRLLNK